MSDFACEFCWYVNNNWWYSHMLDKEHGSYQAPIDTLTVQDTQHDSSWWFSSLERSAAGAPPMEREGRPIQAKYIEYGTHA